MAKTGSNGKKKRAKGRERPRAMAVSIAEPRLRGPRNPRADQSTDKSSASTLGLDGVYGLLLTPWIIMLRQQSMLAQGFLSMITAQQQLAQLWRPPSHRRADADPR